MQRRLLLVVAFAVVAGLLASLFVYRVATQVAQPGDEQEPIVVASANMAMAEIVKSEQVKLVDWPKRSVPAGALRKLADAQDRVVRSSIVIGEPLLEAKLAPGGKGGILPILIPPTLRGVTIKVDDAVKESGFILPGSRVDILVSMVRSQGSQERFAKVILQDVQVLAAGQTVEMRDNKPVTVTTVTFAMTPGQAERLALAQVEGKLTMAMRGLGDNQIVQTSGVNATALLSETSVTPRVEANGAAMRPARALTRLATSQPPSRTESPRPVAGTGTMGGPTPRMHVVTTLKGGKAVEQVFTRGEYQDEWVERPTK